MAYSHEVQPGRERVVEPQDGRREVVPGEVKPWPPKAGSKSLEFNWGLRFSAEDSAILNAAFVGFHLRGITRTTEYPQPAKIVNTLRVLKPYHPWIVTIWITANR